MERNACPDVFNDLQAVLCPGPAGLGRLAKGRTHHPSAVTLGSRTLRSSPESGQRAGCDGAKRKKVSDTHTTVDTLGYLLALSVTAANERDRAQVAELTRHVQERTEQSAEVAFVHQGYAGDEPAEPAQGAGSRRLHTGGLQLVKLPQAKKGFMLLPRRLDVERSLARAARFRCPARDHEGPTETLAGLT